MKREAYKKGGAPKKAPAPVKKKSGGAVKAGAGGGIGRLQKAGKKV